MTKFCPPGYRFLTDLRDEIGADKLRGLLANGERVAFAWNRDNANEPLKPVPSVNWLLRRGEGLMKRGTASLYPFATTQPIVLLVEDARPKHKPHTTTSVAKVRAAASQIANGELPEAEVRKSVQLELGDFTEEQWRRAWSSVPSAKKRARGRPRKNNSET